VIPLEFLNRFVEIDDIVEKGKYVCAESGNIFHRPVMSIEYGEEKIHPTGVDVRPCLGGEEFYLRILQH
jgi:hypothetical protein